MIELVTKEDLARIEARLDRLEGKKIRLGELTEPYYKETTRLVKYGMEKPWKPRRNGTPARVLRKLGKKGKTIDYLRDQVGGQYINVAQALIQLERKGLAEKVKPGVYRKVMK